MIDLFTSRMLVRVSERAEVINFSKVFLRRENADQFSLNFPSLNFPSLILDAETLNSIAKSNRRSKKI